MKIIFKYIVKSMSEKKWRFCLLIFSIAISTGLLVSILGAIDVGVNAYSKPMLEQFEGKDIVISDKEGNGIFSISNMSKNGVEDVEGEMIFNGIINNSENDENIYITLRGKEKSVIDSKDLVEGNTDDLKGATCIISKRVSEEQKLDIGDRIDAIIAGEKQSFTVKGISNNEGAFYTDGHNSYTIIVPYEYFSSKYNLDGKVNTVFAKKSMDNVDKSIEEFNSSNDNYKSEKLFDENMIKEQAGSFTAVLYSMLFIVVVMSGIIIYGSFKLTITERLSVIGTFLSQGATNRKVENILLIESGFYGVIGAVLGNLIGVGGLYLINSIASPLKEYGLVEPLILKLSYFILGTIFAISLSVASALIPIIKVRKLQVKEVILNNVNINMKIGWGKFIVGLIIILLSIYISTLEDIWVINTSYIFLIISVIGLILMYPKVIDLVTGIIYRVCRGRSKMAVFALNNLRTSKILMSNVTLIIISLLSIFMITSISTSLKTMLTDAYAKLQFDVSIGNIQGFNQGELTSTTNKVIGELKDNKKINQDTILEIVQKHGEIDGNMVLVEGIEKDKYSNFNEYLELNGDKYKKLYDEFEKSSNDKILVSDKLQRQLNLQKNDSVKIKINDKEKEYTILGFFNGKLYNNGLNILIDINRLRADYDLVEASEITFKTSENPEEIKNELTPVLKDFGVTIGTKDAFEKSNREQNQMIVDVLSIFSYFAIFIAALGVLNNIIIGFLQRRKELAVLTSVGMGSGNRGGMLMLESLMSVIWSSVFAIGYSYLGLAFFNKMLILLEMPLDVLLDIKGVPIYIVATLIIILLATIPILFRNSKLSVVEELKYE